MKSIFTPIWYQCGIQTIGVVMFQDSKKMQCAYIGVGLLTGKTKGDIEFIRALGTKLPIDEAKRFFPDLDEKKYQISNIKS